MQETRSTQDDPVRTTDIDLPGSSECDAGDKTASVTSIAKLWYEIVGPDYPERPCMTFSNGKSPDYPLIQCRKPAEFVMTQADKRSQYFICKACATEEQTGFFLEPIRLFFEIVDAQYTINWIENNVEV